MDQDDRIQGVYVNVFDKDDEQDEEKIRYCESCLKNGYLRILKSRLYLDDKGKAIEPEPDFDSCHCGNIYKISETKIELEDIVEVEEPNTSIKEPEVTPIFT